MLQKLIKGILLTTLLFAVIAVYFLLTQNILILQQRITTHILYTLFLYISIIVLYTYRSTNKLYTYSLITMILLHIVLLGDIVIKNNIGLHTGTYILICGLVIGGIATMYIRHPVRYILITIISISFVGVVYINIFPMYETIPQTNDLMRGNQTTIYNQGIQQGTVIIKNNLGTKQLSLQNIKTQDIDITQTPQILFTSTSPNESQKLLLDIENRAFLNISPQSAIKITTSGDNIQIEIQKGNIAYYITKEQSEFITIIGKGTSITDIQNTELTLIIQQSKQKQQALFIEALGGKIITQPIINTLIGYTLHTLYTLSPDTYRNNRKNYLAVQTYLDIDQPNSSKSSFSGENIRSILYDMIEQIKKGAKQTTINERIAQ